MVNILLFSPPTHYTKLVSAGNNAIANLLEDFSYLYGVLSRLKIVNMEGRLMGTPDCEWIDSWWGEIT